jgi:hypothetical protein
MRLTTKGLALLVPLLAATGVLAQGADRRPEGNTGSGAAMSGEQRNATGAPTPGGGAMPPANSTQSPRPPGSEDRTQGRPEGNLGSGAAMTGSQRNSTGLPATGGGATVPAPTTTSPRQ